MSTTTNYNRTFNDFARTTADYNRTSNDFVRGVLSSSRYNTSGSLESSIDFVNSDSRDVLRNMVMSSSLYKSAQNLFSNDTVYGSAYLEQLYMIGVSQSINDENSWDEFVDSLGGTSKYEKALIDAYNNCMDEIRQLVANYYTFKNSLPAEQIEQQRAAGYNAAVTGQGVDGSSMPSEGLVQDNPSMQSYSNDQLSNGITSFVEFIGAVSSLTGTALSGKSLMGMLDIAEREGYNKQETHDFMMAQLGITTDSPYRVLNADNTPVVRGVSKVASAKTAADENFLDSSHNVAIGGDSDPNTPVRYEMLSGRDVLNRLSEYNLINRLGQTYVDNIRQTSSLQYASAVSSLENEWAISRFQGGIAQNDFESDYFRSRNGVTEGSAQTSIVESLKTQRDSEAAIASFNAWLSDYKYQMMSDWGEQLSERPALAPFFYKALFDFGMEDTFYHQSGAGQALKYGMDNLQKGASIFSDVVGGFLKGFSKKAPVRRSTYSKTSGPKGETITESTTVIE